MAKQRNAIHAGIFMIISLALIVAVIIAISGSDRFTQTFRTYGIAFSLSDDVGGLRAGDDVRIGGMRVGSVHDIQMVEKKTDAATIPQLIVYIELPAKYPVAKDADVEIEKGLTGSASVNFSSIGSGQPIASADDFLQGRPDSLSAFVRKVSQLQPDITEIVSNVKTASDKLNDDLDKLGNTADTLTLTGLSATSTIHDVRVRLPDVLARYDELIAAGVEALHAIREFVGPPSGDFRTTIANLRKLTGDLTVKLPQVMTQVHDVLGSLDTTVDKAGSAVLSLQSTLDNTKDLTGSLRSVIATNKSNLDGIITGLKSTSDNLKSASAEIRHAPWRLLYQPTPAEVGNQTIYDEVRQFADGADALDQASAALHDMLRTKDADPAEIKKLVDQLDDSFNKFQAIQQKLFKDIKE